MKKQSFIFPVLFNKAATSLVLNFFLNKLSADSLLQWRAEGKVAVWLRVPISLSRCAAAASTHGFAFHHAKDDHAVLALWLGEGESRLPGFATHQVGVAGRDLYRMKVHSGLGNLSFQSLIFTKGPLSTTSHHLHRRMEFAQFSWS